MRKKAIILAAFAVALTMAVGATPAWGYFTDWTEANGGLVVNVTPEPAPQEWYAEGVKHVVITNDADEEKGITATAPVFARVRILSTLPVDAQGQGWFGPVQEEDGQWYYYGSSVDNLTEIEPGPDGKSNELTVKVTFPKVQSDEEPNGAIYGQDYNVVVYYESTAAKYKTDEGSGATVSDPDWTVVQNDQGGN